MNRPDLTATGLLFSAVCALWLWLWWPVPAAATPRRHRRCHWYAELLTDAGHE